MPCKHKFAADLDLGYVDWEVKTLIIGTFNPEWKSCKNNSAQWFYGRTTRNEFWSILPKVHGEPSLLTGHRSQWLEFCKRNGLAITDIIRSLKNADENVASHREVICKFKDDDFAQFDIEVTDIPSILEKHPSIKQLCLTRQTLGPIWNQCFADTFKWINSNRARNINSRFLRSPSRGARKGVVGPFADFVANRWKEQGYITQTKMP